MAKVELKARISADAREFYRTMSKVQASVKPVAIGVAAGLGAGAAAVGAAWIKAVAGLVAYGSAVQDLMDKTGLGAAAIQTLGYAAGQTGADMTAIAPAMKGLANSLQMAQRGGKDAQRSFAELGLSFTALAARSPDQQITDVLAAIGKIKDPTQRAALAVDVLGKSGQALVPMAAQFRALAEQAQKLGLIIPTDQIAAADRLGDALGTLKAKLGAVGATAVGPDLGILAETVERITSNPAVWAAIAPALRTASSAMAEFAVSMGKIVQDEDNLQNLAVVAQNIASGFKLSAEAVAKFAETIGPALEMMKLAQATAGFAAERLVTPMLVENPTAGQKLGAGVGRSMLSGATMGVSELGIGIRELVEIVRARLPQAE